MLGHWLPRLRFVIFELTDIIAFVYRWNAMHYDQITVFTVPLSPSVITSVCWELAKTSLVL